MSISDLVPWRWGKKRVPVRHEPGGFKEPETPSTRGDVLAPRQVAREPDLWFDDMWNRFSLVPFNRFFEQLGEPERFDEPWSTVSPRADVVQDDKQVRVSVELPGMDENDLDISLSHDVLTIRGEKKVEKEDKGKNYYRMERAYGAFERRISLPGNVDADKIEATYQRGVLTVTLPKTTSAETRTRIAVKTRS